MYWVYVLYSVRIKKFYTGYTRNLEKRLEHHNFGLDRWSKRGIPWKIVYVVKFDSKRDALIRERFLKSGKGREFIKAEVAQVVKAPV